MYLFRHFPKLKLRILLEKILSISLKLNFTSNTLGCNRLKQVICEKKMKRYKRLEKFLLGEQNAKLERQVWYKRRFRKLTSSPVEGGVTFAFTILLIDLTMGTES